ncbi:methyl-accepting chemotaxis protein [Paenibacillus ginsengarvi]|uniref:Methyl-accepting chemotaxis protein n=1 Tax=Paenibacillus ginsengarvi TaxID=400777 RepID=A0A3B0BCH7_9BACL|nr:methyl-accepting chemotaxis protein [Paenibacillus ginsengarvi]RKN70149.1 methyl-accepting chemotaxis protein [Paenibacillus ginsengarvi]
MNNKYVVLSKLRGAARSVGVKLFLVLVVSIAVIVLGVGIVSYDIAKDAIETKVADNAEQTIVQAGEKIDVLLKQFRGASVQVFGDKELVNQIVKLHDESADAAEKQQAKTKVAESFAGIMRSADGMVGLTTFPLDGKLSSVRVYTDEPWFRQTLDASGSIVWLNTTKAGYIEKKSDAVFGFAQVLKDSMTGAKLAVLLAEINGKVLRDALAGLSMGDTGKIVLLDPANTVNASADEDAIGGTFAVAIPPQSESSAAGGHLRMKDDSGAEQLVVYYRSPVTGWTLVGAVPRSELLKETDRIFAYTALAAALSIVVALLIGLWVIRKIGRPLAALRDTMRQGESGDLTVRVRESGRKDEIGEVGASFNRMMEQLQQLVRATADSAKQVLDTSLELSSASRKTAASALEIASATEQIAGGAASLAQEAERGSDVTGEIEAQMRLVGKAGEEMGLSAKEVRLVSGRGATYMTSLIEKTQTAEAQSRSMLGRVDRLKESAGSIRGIVDVLHQITSRTNILSLNAAIEAARAGAAGRSFAVVAEEICKLADQSRQSLQTVGAMTESIEAEVEETVKALNEAYPIYREQIAAVNEADQIFRGVKEEMDGLDVRLDEVLRSTHTLEQSQRSLSEAMNSVSAARGPIVGRGGGSGVSRERAAWHQRRAGQAGGRSGEHVERAEAFVIPVLGLRAGNPTGMKTR